MLQHTQTNGVNFINMITCYLLIDTPAHVTLHICAFDPVIQQNLSCMICDLKVI